MNSVREYYSQRVTAEKPAFVNVMKAVPPDQGDYKPHPRSTSSGDLLWLLATEIHDACTLIDHGEVNYVYKQSPGVSESVAAYEKHVAELEANRVLTRCRGALSEVGARGTRDGDGVVGEARRIAVRAVDEDEHMPAMRRVCALPFGFERPVGVECHRHFFVGG